MIGYGSSTKSTRPRSDHKKSEPGAFPIWLGLVIFGLGLSTVIGAVIYYMSGH